MKANLLYEELAYKIRGAVFQVYNTLGFGHKESVYAKALSIEFNKKTLPFEREKRLDIVYDGKSVGIYRPDFVIADSIILEIKSLEFMPTHVEKQLIYYLKGTNYRVGLLVNFGGVRLVIKRKIWGKDL